MDITPTIESLQLENLQLKLEVRAMRLQVLTLMRKDIEDKIPNIIDEIEALKVELDKRRPKLEAVK